MASRDENIHYQAVCAAGTWEIDAAWPHVLDLVRSEDIDRDLLFAAIDAEGLHSVSLGSFRLPQPFYHNMVRLYPRERLFAGPLEEHGGMMGYPKTIEQDMVGFCAEQLLHYVPESVYFPCTLAN